MTLLEIPHGKVSAEARPCRLPHGVPAHRQPPRRLSLPGRTWPPPLSPGPALNDSFPQPSRPLHCPLHAPHPRPVQLTPSSTLSRRTPSLSPPSAGASRHGNSRLESELQLQGPGSARPCADPAISRYTTLPPGCPSSKNTPVPYWRPQT